MRNVPQPGRSSVLRHINAINTLRVLRQMGPCSRADLARTLGLAAPTVTNVVKDLLTANLVLPKGEGKSRGGRPPDTIGFNASHGCIAGVQITANSVFFLLTDLDGVLLSRHQTAVEKGKSSPPEVCVAIQEGLRGLLKEHRKTRKQLLALVVAVPAVANVEEGTVLSISTMREWRSVPLRTMLAKLFPCAILIENDTNLAAQGERYCGAARTEESFVYVNIGTNVSAGIILQSSIYHGAQWCAGEIAYLRLPRLSRRQPQVHEFGELEELITESGIVAQWSAAQASAVGKSRKSVASEILDLAAGGDRVALSVLQNRAEIAADILINLSLILHPGLILLGGSIGSHPAMLSAIRDQLDGVEFAVAKVAAAELSDMGVLWGAIAVALEMLPSILIPGVLL